MRKIFLILACIITSHLVNAQLKTTPVCLSFNVDVLNGSVNNLYPESPLGEVMNKLPCFTSAIEEPSATGCAGSFYKDKGINFYTYRDYIEITKDFKGTMSLPIMGADHNSLFKWFGLPKVKDPSWEAYQMRHGMMIVFFGADGKINRMLLTSKSPESLRMCD